MIQYLILGTKVTENKGFSNDDFETDPFKDSGKPNLNSYQTGEINETEILKSKFNQLLNQIPKENLKEFEETGKTSFKIIETKSISLERV